MLRRHGLTWLAAFRAFHLNTAMPSDPWVEGKLQNGERFCEGSQPIVKDHEAWF